MARLGRAIPRRGLRGLPDTTNAPRIQRRASGVSAAANTTTHAITLPSGVVAEETLVVVFSCAGNPALSTATSGWRLLGQASIGTSVTQGVFLTIASGSDTLSVTTSTAVQSSHISYRVANASTVTFASANGSSTDSDPPSLTPAWVSGSGSESFLWLATRAGAGTTQATAAPASYTNLTTQAASGASGAATAVAERTLNTATEDPGTFTSATAAWASMTVAISPRHAAETLSDDFTDNTVDSLTRWPGSYGTYSETGGKATVTSPVAGGWSAYESRAQYSLADSQMWVQITVPAVNTANSFASLSAYDSASNFTTYIKAYVDTLNNTVGLSATVASVAQFDDHITYDPAAHAWLRVRETYGTLYLDTSPDGVTWANRFSRATPAIIRASNVLTIDLEVLGDAVASPPSVTFDNLNIADGGPPAGVATGTVAFTGAAAGQRTPTASAAGTATFTGAASGKRTPTATGSGTWAFAGVATGEAPPNQGSAAGSWTFTGAAAGTKTPKGAATGTAGFTGAATGVRAARGSASGTWTAAGVAAGSTTRSGTATGALAWAGAAVGVAPAVGAADGASSGTWSYAGTAVGTSTRRGTTVGTWTFAGASAGVSARSGTAAGTTAWVAVALSGNARAGAATGTATWAGSASGTSSRRGTGTGTWAITGSATGAAPTTAAATGAASATVTYQGTAAGSSVRRGSSTGGWAYHGNATGAATHRGVGTGLWSFTGAATGSTGLAQFSGTAAGACTYVGTAVGGPPLIVGAMRSVTRPGPQALPTARQVAHMRGTAPPDLMPDTGDVYTDIYTEDYPGSGQIVTVAAMRSTARAAPRALPAPRLAAHMHAPA